MTLKVLDLFSGIGGFSLGLERAGMETAAFCEIEDYPRQVLKKHWPNIPIFNDIRELKGHEVGSIDLICGGYPCQPFSTAGKRAGQEDDRHLWPEMLRLLQELRPRWLIAENVAGHISMGLDNVLSDLENEGYTAWPLVIPACAVDAKHRRDRVWIIAHSNKINSGQRSRQQPEGKKPSGLCKGVLAHTQGERLTETRQPLPGRSNRATGPSSTSIAMANPITERSQRRNTNTRSPETPQPSHTREITLRDCKWPAEPSVGRVANGIPKRVDRLKSLGNSIVPQIAQMIGQAIMTVELQHQS